MVVKSRVAEVEDRRESEGVGVSVAEREAHLNITKEDAYY